MKRSIQIVVLIDALGWEYIKDRKFLNDVLPYRKPLDTVLGFSSGAIPTILTGVVPAKHRHWNLFYYDPKSSPFWWVKYFSFLPEPWLNNRYGRKILKEMGKRLFGLGKQFECCVSPVYLPYFNWVEKKNIYDSGGIIGAPSIFDDLEREGTPYKVYSYHHSTDAEIINQVKDDLENTDASFFFVYLSEMDMFLHMNCGETTKIQAKLTWYEEQLSTVFREAKQIDPDATFVICSDHGMTPVTRKHDLVADVESLGLKLRSDYLSVYDSTMARFWFFNDAARTRMIAKLGSLTCGRILSSLELQNLGLGFEDNRFGDLIFLLNPGWLIAKSDFNGGGWEPAGMHGYHPEDPYSDAVFLSNCDPGFEMRYIGDIHTVMKQMQERAMTVEQGVR
jgi:Type I phosphodiesterase / nucleotide pyrophosphatase